ncbi:hypothetical protein B0J11DRAFT_524487 [Dendryphion nanum]|uniref:Ankyrin n=1 Tax=Dendryphion nanum TaxID=256645 RepID=A0A9P9E074_9PLEO|nr:hypothetical protein B0J11DRAFT_524487 [Dendryphion nanum]
MNPLSVTGSIIAILQLSAKVLAYLNDFKDASKDRTQCIVETLNLRGLLFNLKDQVEWGDPTKPWYTAVQALAAKNGTLDQFKQVLEMLQTKLTDGGRLGRAGDALVWKFKKEEIANILHRMERLKSLVEIALQMDHFKLSEAIKSDTDFVRAHVPVIQSGVEKIQQDQDFAKYRQLVEWISPLDYPAQQSDILRRRQEGTGQWFLDAPETAKWLTEAKGTLFCPGIPGAGKTMIAAIAIDHLSKSAQNSPHGLAYVYCNYKAQEEQDASSLLAAILKQLVQAHPMAVDPVERLHEQHANMGTRPSLDEICSALQDVLERCSTAYIVIDALDECRDSDGTRRTFLARLQTLQAGRDIRLMVTSRFIPEIQDRFRGAMKLEIQASEEDVKRFVAGQTYRLPKCIQRSDELQNMVQAKIVEAADGMFLLARLHMDSLLDKRTPREVKSTLATLSRGSTALDDAYEDALARIKGQLEGDCERARNVLSWITFAKRPLTTAEICCALAVEPGETRLDPEGICDVEDLVSVCAGLVVIDQESSIVRLVHYTTQDYFERIKDTWNPAAPQHIATTCFTYLSFEAFMSGSCATDHELKHRLANHKFLDYAAKHGGDHARAAEAEVCELACSFLLDHKLLACAAQVLLCPEWKYKGYSQSYPTITSLHYTTQFGLFRITHELLSKLGEEPTKFVNVNNSWDDAPLAVAGKHGHAEITGLLLDKGANLNAEGGIYGSALQAASFGGHEQVVKLLLDKGADLNAEGRRGWILRQRTPGGFI